MKCICGSGVNEEIEDLRADCQKVYTYSFGLEKRVLALRELWGVSIKNNTGLKAQVTWLENVLRGVCELASRNFSPSLHPLPLTRSPGDRE